MMQGLEGTVSDEEMAIVSADEAIAKLVGELNDLCVESGEDKDGVKRGLVLILIVTIHTDLAWA